MSGQKTDNTVNNGQEKPENQAVENTADGLGRNKPSEGKPDQPRLQISTLDASASETWRNRPADAGGKAEPQPVASVLGVQRGDKAAEEKPQPQPVTSVLGAQRNSIRPAESSKEDGAETAAKDNKPLGGANRPAGASGRQEGAAQAGQNTVELPPIIIQQSGGRLLSLAAMILGALALGASGLLFVQGQNILKTQELSFQQRINEAALGESKNAEMLQQAMQGQMQLSSAFEQLHQQQQQQGMQVEQTKLAYQQLLRSRSDWLVDETEATLNMASQQLLLSGNVPMAITVLENIENRLSRFEHADLLPIKQAVSDDLAALKKQPYLDLSGVSLRLDRLENAVAGLPLALDSAMQSGKGEAAPKAEPDPNAKWWERAWDSTVQGLTSLVEVRYLENGDAMLLAPAQAYFVRENLRIRLLDARIALMQHNSEVYLNDLANAETAVKQYFDKSSPAVKNWLKEVGELKSLELQAVSNDALKASLAAVRTYQETVRANADVQLPPLPEESGLSGQSESGQAAASAVQPAVPAAVSASSEQQAQPASAPVPAAGGGGAASEAAASDEDGASRAASDAQ
ncbi:MAG: uroporphyrinogen-III C-methyltransferase [Neisseria sp.]|nr:uroporphyrinogen-III C-methyltransferase [Neisseria sp.]